MHKGHFTVKLHFRGPSLGKLLIKYILLLFNFQYLQGALDPKDGAASVHVGTSQTPAYYPYEYTFGQYPYERYG